MLGIILMILDWYWVILSHVESYCIILNHMGHHVMTCQSAKIHEDSKLQMGFVDVSGCLFYALHSKQFHRVRVPHSASKLEAATVGCFKKAVGRMEQTRHALPDKPPSKRSPSAESLVRTGWHLTTVAMLALEIGINVKNTGRYWHLVAKSEFAKNLDKINLRIHVWWIDELLMNSQVLRTVLPLGFCRFPGHRPSIIRVVQVRPGTKEELHLFTIWRCPPGPNGLQTPQDMHFAYV